MMDKEENVTAFSELTRGLDGCATNSSNFSRHLCSKLWLSKVVCPLAASKTEWKPNNQHTGLLFQNIMEQQARCTIWLLIRWAESLRMREGRGHTCSSLSSPDCGNTVASCSKV